MTGPHYIYRLPRAVDEAVTYSVDVSALTSSPTSATAAVSAYMGTDPGAAATLTAGPTVSGTVISVQCLGGIPGVTYRIALHFAIEGTDTRTLYLICPVI